MLCFMILSLHFSNCFGSFVDFFFSLNLFIFYFCLAVSLFPSRLLILHFFLRQLQNNITGDDEAGWFSVCVLLFSCTSFLLADTFFWKSCYQFELLSENTKFCTILWAMQHVFLSFSFSVYWKYCNGSYCYVIDWGWEGTEDGWNLQI